MYYKISIIITIFLSSGTVNAQYSKQVGLFAKEYSKEVCLFKSKNFIITDVLGDYSASVRKVEMEALTASNSGELTTVYYKSEDKNMEGLVLGFFGSRWNEAGVIFTSYAFKNLSSLTALEIMGKLKEAVNTNQKYLSAYADRDETNIYFKYDDISFIIYYDQSFKIRVLWENFDATWDYRSFEKTIKRFNKKLK